jgi:membrane-associated phospholipid phosphatase
MIREVFYDFFGYNAKLFFHIHNNTNGEVVQTVLSNLSNLFYFYNFVIYFVIFVIYALFQIKQKGAKKIDLYWKVILKLGLIYSVFIFTFTLLKHTINMIRPLCTYEPWVINSIIHISEVRCLSSFPSAHSGMALFCAYCIWNYLDKTQKAVILSIVLLTGIARISMAMHFPADIIYGYLISILVIIIGNLMYKDLPKIIHDILYNIFIFIVKTTTGVKKS